MPLHSHLMAAVGWRVAVPGASNAICGVLDKRTAIIAGWRDIVVGAGRAAPPARTSDVHHIMSLQWLEREHSSPPWPHNQRPQALGV